jgi:general secretion pathway protein K
MFLVVTLIALCVAREAFVDIAAVRNERDMAVAKFAARSGLAATIFQLIRHKTDPAFRKTEELVKFSGALGEGAYEVEIVGESGKFDINHIRNEQLQALVKALSINEYDSSIIVDSILDWIDKDSQPRANGAEEDYYSRLNLQYHAKNGFFDNIEELLLVRGVSPEYFYGWSERGSGDSTIHHYGLSECLTIYSPSTAIDPNYAPLPVLLALPGITPELAAGIEERRKVRPFIHPTEIEHDLGLEIDPKILIWLTTQPPDIYTLTATGNRIGSKIKRTIKSVVQLDREDPEQYRILGWCE